MLVAVAGAAPAIGLDVAELTLCECGSWGPSIAQSSYRIRPTPLQRAAAAYF